MPDLPGLTIILGPQTRVSLALNAYLRDNRQYLTGKGMTVPGAPGSSSTISWKPT